MPKVVSSSEARDNLGGLLKWTQEHHDEVIIKLRGEPAGVLMTYEEYEEIIQLRKQEQKRKALAALRELRERVQSRLPKDLTDEEAYRIAGFGEDVIKSTLEKDRELAEAEQS